MISVNKCISSVDDLLSKALALSNDTYALPPSGASAILANLFQRRREGGNIHLSRGAIRFCVERKPQRHVLGIHLSRVFVKRLYFLGAEVNFSSLSTDLFGKINLSWINQRTTRDEEHEFCEDKSHRATLCGGCVAAGTAGAHSHGSRERNSSHAPMAGDVFSLACGGFGSSRRVDADGRVLALAFSDSTLHRWHTAYGCDLGRLIYAAGKTPSGSARLGTSRCFLMDGQYRAHFNSVQT